MCLVTRNQQKPSPILPRPFRFHGGSLEQGQVEKSELKGAGQRLRALLSRDPHWLLQPQPHPSPASHTPAGVCSPNTKLFHHQPKQKTIRRQKCFRNTYQKATWRVCFGPAAWASSQCGVEVRNRKRPEVEESTDQREAEGRPVTQTQKHPPGIRYRCQDQVGLLSQHAWRFSVPGQGSHLA